MKTSTTMYLCAGLALVCLGVSVTMLSREPKRSDDAPSSERTVATTQHHAIDPVASTPTGHGAPLASLDLRTSTEDDDAAASLSDEEIEAMTAKFRAATAQARRAEDDEALAQRSELYAQNLDMLDTAAADADAQGQTQQAAALRRRAELLSARAREERLD